VCRVRYGCMDCGFESPGHAARAEPLERIRARVCALFGPACRVRCGCMARGFESAGRAARAELLERVCTRISGRVRRHVFVGFDMQMNFCGGATDSIFCAR